MHRGIDACIPADAHVVGGGKVHVCLQQTVLGLLQASRKTCVARDTLGSRQPEDKETAIRRMERHGAEIVTSETIVFAWLQIAEHPGFRDAIRLQGRSRCLA